MKALRVIDTRLELADVSPPDAADEALVRVVCSGICNTDLEIARGYAGFNGTIGHEFVGVVKKCADRPDLIGTRVVGEINAGCGKCELCVAGDPRHCPTRTVLGIHGRDGAHAEFLSLPSRNLIVLPASVPDEAAVFAEPLAAAYGISEQVEITPETKVAVIGDGKLGLLCAMTARLRSEHVTLIGKHRDKLSIVANAEVKTVLLGDTPLNPRYFDVVIEASGSESGFATAVEIVRPRGKVVLKSTFHGAASWEPSKIVVDEISIVGSRCGRLAPAVELLASNTVNLGALISDEFRLEDGLEAMEKAGRKGVLKILLRP